MIKPGPFKLAMAQMRVKGGDRAWNLSHASELISEAASNGADVVLLPECMDLGWTHPASQTAAEAIPDGQVCQKLMRAAKQNGVFVCTGLTEQSAGKIYNAAILIGREGELLSLHRKINELDFAQAYYARGDRLGVVETELGKIGIMICADGVAHGQVLSRSLCQMGADFILSPSAWAVVADHDNSTEPYGGLWRNAYGTVSREFNTPIIGVSNVGPITGGPWQGRNCIGCSLAVDSTGEELLQGPYGVDAECILYVDIQPAQPKAMR